MFDGRAMENSCEISVGSTPDTGSERKLPVLFVVHQATSNPGHVGNWFRRNGYPIDICRHYAGQPLPHTLRGHCGAVIFGGPQSANDDTDFIRREIDWIGLSLEERKPFFGICLGAQMLARHLGARVDHCPSGAVEIGYHGIEATAEGAALAFPQTVFQWHREGFELARGSTLLATAHGCYPNQAFRHDTAFGVQFHPEITYELVNRWSGGNPMRLLMRGAKPRREQIDHHLTHVAPVQAWLDSFLRQWVAGTLVEGR